MSFLLEYDKMVKWSKKFRQCLLFDPQDYKDQKGTKRIDAFINLRRYEQTHKDTCINDIRGKGVYKMTPKIRTSLKYVP